MYTYRFGFICELLVRDVSVCVVGSWFSVATRPPAVEPISPPAQMLLIAPPTRC